MTNPTRKEILDAQLARQWAERNKACEVSSPEIQAAANFILAHTNPLTMAEVEWDDDKHFLAEAESGWCSKSGWGSKVIMISEYGDSILCIQPPNAGGISLVLLRSDLTPTGKRYTLTEVQE